MAFIVPPLQPHLYARFHFGACKLPATIPDPGHAPSSGIVQLRGALSPDPLFDLRVTHPTALFTFFTLPAGMRPVAERWLTCQVSSFMGMYAGVPRLCVVRTNGDVQVQLPTGSLSVDGAVFFDDLSFFAESTRLRPAPARRPRAAPRARRPR